MIVPSLKDIRLAVCLNFNVADEKLDAHDKTLRYVRPRQIAMFLARSYTGLSYPQIGRAFGGRDHATAWTAFKRITALQIENEHVAQHVKDCLKMLDSVVTLRAMRAGSLRAIPLVQARAA